ncbi:MAG: hypothetical protein A2W19_05360 [Spirochaetes bacterium RBG_16_49_21]|nr:MAG: hypothetical protein A2W19_05360 [Spirochaetes bacterium RBG_16_49_21]
MDMQVIGTSLLIFSVILLIHIIYWRLSKPKKQIKALFLIFIIIPLFISIVAGLFIMINIIMFVSLSELLLIIILYTALSCAYIQTYPAIQAWSPSLLLVNLIGSSKEPIKLEKLRDVIDENKLIKDRVIDLETEGLIHISKQNKSIILALKGKILAAFFIIYRRFIGLKPGEG